MSLSGVDMIGSPEKKKFRGMIVSYLTEIVTNRLVSLFLLVSLLEEPGLTS
jgi:hypothetical protein